MDLDLKRTMGEEDGAREKAATSKFWVWFQFSTIIFKNMRGKQCYKTKVIFFLVDFKLVSQQRCSLLDSNRTLSLSFLLIEKTQTLGKN